jgi:hypothetical protein
MLEDDREKNEPLLDAEAGSAPAADRGYKVGYRRPPLQSRFKPGTSGNNKGRPKGSHNAKTIVGKVLNDPITLRENGKARRTSKLEAMITAIAHKAMKGDTPALNAVVALLIRTGILNEAENQELTTSLPKDDEAIVNDYVRRKTAAVADAGEGG